METKINTSDGITTVPTDDPMFPWFFALWCLHKDNGRPHSTAFAEICEAMNKAERYLSSTMQDETQNYCFNGDTGAEIEILLKRFAAEYTPPARLDEELDENSKRIQQVSKQIF